MMRFVNGLAAAIVVLGLGLGLWFYVIPMAKAVYTAQRLNAVLATSDKGQQFRLIDVLEGVAAQTVQQAIQQQQQKAEAAKAEGK